MAATSRLSGKCKGLMALAKASFSSSASGPKQGLIISPELQKFMGSATASPFDALSKVLEYADSHAEYIKPHAEDLSDRLKCDENLKMLFGKDSFEVFEIPKLVSKHFLDK